MGRSCPSFGIRSCTDFSSPGGESSGAFPPETGTLEQRGEVTSPGSHSRVVLELPWSCFFLAIEPETLGAGMPDFTNKIARHPVKSDFE